MREIYAAICALERCIKRIVSVFGVVSMSVAHAAAMIALLGASSDMHAQGTESNHGELTNISLGICDDGDEWPPYTYYERVNGERTHKLIGYSIDVIDEIFARHGIHYTAHLIPWARCQAEVKTGVTYQMALNASYSVDRDRDFWLTRSYYTATNYYFYSRQRYPQGLAIANAGDLKHFPVCGIFGSNYTTYGFKSGELDQGTMDFPAMIAKLHMGRCAVFMEKYEVMAGFMAIGKRYLADPDLGRSPVPGMPSTAFHMAISRAYPEGVALKALLDQELAQMEASGRLEVLLKKAMPK
jgi:polar amino acid transport system substrate-binding protein